MLVYYHDNIIYKSPCLFEVNVVNTYSAPELMCMNKWIVKLNQIIRLKEKCNQDFMCCWFLKAACGVDAHLAWKKREAA